MGIGAGRSCCLFRNRAAGDTVARIPGGIGLLVVGFRVNDNRRSTIAEERMAVGA
jgi:hypothetical protein